jgi:hypothetical protein
MLNSDDINRLQELVQSKIETSKNEHELKAMKELDEKLADLLGSIVD